MWSSKHNLSACNSCETNTVPHRAHGLCRNCYAKSKGYVWQKTYQEANRSAITEYAAEWRKANPASISKSRKTWAKANNDKTRKYLTTWRKNNKPPFCLICGESRVTDWAHLIPHKSGGPVVHWNLIPLCPTHHRCLDANLLSLSEALIIDPYLQEAKSLFNLSSRALVSAA